MMTAGRRRRERTVAIALIVLAICMHFLAWSMVGRFADVGLDPDKITPGGDHGEPAAVLVADAVAGDGVGDPRLLRAIGSRSDPHLAGPGAEGLFRADRDDGALHRADGRAAGGAVHQCSGGARRAAVAGLLWGGGCHGLRSRRVGGRAHDRAVQDHRSEADPVRRADRGRGDRRSLRDRAAGGRNTVLRQLVAHRFPAIGRVRRARAGHRQHRLLARPRRARRRDGARRRAERRPRPARHLDRDCSRRASAIMPSPPPAFRAPSRASAVGRRAFAPRHPRAHCGRRSGSCSGATPG